MKSSSFYVVQGWMVNELKLKGNNLLVFAVIYGFSKDGQGKFDGSLKYLAECTGSSKNTVIKSLNELVELEYILKATELISNITFCKYMQNDIVVQKLVRGSAETGLKGSAETGTNKDTLNNIEDNKQVLFSGSYWSNYDNLQAKLLTDNEFIEKYKGVDLKRYIEDCLAWSVSKNKKSTNNGWYLTLRQWMRRALDENTLHKKPTKETKQTGYQNF